MSVFRSHDYQIISGRLVPRSPAPRYPADACLRSAILAAEERAKKRAVVIVTKPEPTIDPDVPELPEPAPLPKPVSGVPASSPETTMHLEIVQELRELQEQVKAKRRDTWGKDFTPIDDPSKKYCTMAHGSDFGNDPRGCPTFFSRANHYIRMGYDLTAVLDERERYILSGELENWLKRVRAFSGVS